MERLGAFRQAVNLKINLKVGQRVVAVASYDINQHQRKLRLWPLVKINVGPVEFPSLGVRTPRDRDVRSYVGP